MIRFILLSCCWSFYFLLAAQSPCLPDGIVFSTQEQIDDFQLDYPDCTEIEGNVTITGANISNLQGLSVLTAVYGDLHIGADPVFTTLTSLSGLDNLTVVGGNLFIYKNASLTSLEALAGLEHIGNNLYIIWNEELNLLTGLEGIDSVPGNLLIQRNTSLENLEGLQELKHIGGDLFLLLNTSLENLSGLEGIQAIPGDLILVGAGLTSLSGLDNLASVGGNLRIGDMDVFLNTSLTDISALQNLELIGGVLLIYWNQQLETLDGLENVDGYSLQSIEILNNPMLSGCAVQGLCDYLLSPTGTALIAGNAPGCTSSSEVTEACESLDIPEAAVQNSLGIHPNPGCGSNIVFTLREACPNCVLCCYSSLGQEVFQDTFADPFKTVEVAGWQRGVYLAVVFENGKPCSQIKFFLP